MPLWSRLTRRRNSAAARIALGGRSSPADDAPISDAAPRVDGFPKMTGPARYASDMRCVDPAYALKCRWPATDYRMLAKSLP